jgi:glucokinase
MSHAKDARNEGQRRYLVGDVGGTRSRLAIFGDRGHLPRAEAVFPSQEHATFEEIAERFLADVGSPPLAAAVLAIAAPIRRGKASFTNLPWKLDERALARRLRVPQVTLVNDLAASAKGCLGIGRGAIVELTPSRPVSKGENLAVIAAGTGLGEARLVWTGDGYLALPTEGGHRDFSPRNELEIDLWRFLSRRYPQHVSWERVVSGAGLGSLYDFFSERAGPTPEAVLSRLARDDRNAVICELGLSREHEPAAQAVDLFATLYGAEAGNLALGELAVGGVYVTGNIARLIVPARRHLFLSAFQAKGRFSGMLSQIPIAVVTDPLVNRRGALAIARETPAPARPSRRRPS